MKNPDAYNVRSIERAIQILDCFDDDHPTWGLTELAEEIGLHKATAHRIMTTLLNYDYLEKTSEGQRYKLGLKLIRIGCRYFNRLDLQKVAYPYLKDLVDKYNEACDLSVFDGREIFYLDVIQCNHALTIAASPGMRLPAHCTASGKVFLAFLPDNEYQKFVEQPLPKLTQNTITDPELLRENLRDVKEKGFAVDYEEMEMGIFAISTPILNKEGEIVATISIPAPVNRISEEKINELSSALKRTSKKISENLGC